ncbi:MAG: 3-dehydroquinate synthase [Gammaproteobacteria bacterium]|nr:MAG: 3-dehydroquinate synthase [Gammaproteobacteria bacterium]
MRTLTVDLGDRSYPIFIGKSQFKAENLLPYIKGKQIMIVTNETVAPLYLEKFKQELLVDDIVAAEKQIGEIVLPDGESYKNLDTINSIFDGLMQDNFDRKTTLIALGGGVIGDMTGFAAACYRRGVNFIQVPTTLLSQVDSSVGGKTGVNHPLGKNMIGAFYQPQVVVADITTLDTLEDRELRAGIAEVIKYGFIYDAEFFAWLEENLNKLLQRDYDVLEYAVYRSCQIKAEIVAKDELEHGIRALLNFGHTFGHAIETFTGYSQWLHGEAIATGMCMALSMSQLMGWLTEEDAQRGIDIIKIAQLPADVPEGMSTDDFVRLMQADKKVLDGVVRLVLIKGIGEGAVVDKYAPEIFRETIEQYCGK